MNNIIQFVNLKNLSLHQMVQMIAIYGGEGRKHRQRVPNVLKALRDLCIKRYMQLNELLPRTTQEALGEIYKWPHHAILNKKHV